MNIYSIHHSSDVRRAATQPHQIPPLECVAFPSVPTEQKAHCLICRTLVLKSVACAETLPVDLRFRRINDCFVWTVSALLRALGMHAMTATVFYLLLRWRTWRDGQ